MPFGVYTLADLGCAQKGAYWQPARPRGKMGAVPGRGEDPPPVHEEALMALQNLASWVNEAQGAPAAACGTACGAGDAPEAAPTACGSACGAGSN